MSSSTAGQLAMEDDAPVSSKVIPRAASEEAAGSVASCGGRVVVMRLSPIHDTRKQGHVTYMIQLACEKGLSAYVDDGRIRPPAAHRLDTGRLYRLALKKGRAGAGITRWRKREWPSGKSPRSSPGV